MSEEFPIEFDSLRKVYGTFVSVNDLTLKIKRNSFTGLLGPNGAGKSTSLKILTNLITPTSGHAYLNGIDVQKDPKHALMGVGTVVETPEFYTYLTPVETFKYVGEIYGMTRESISNETCEILEKVKMTGWTDKKIGEFSKGMRQRIAIGLALMNSPSIIILDEPTSGLDPRGMAEMREILKNIRNNKNLTVLMSSHMMHEVSDLCDHISLINQGTLIRDQDYEKFVTNSDTHTLIVKPLDAPNQHIIDAIKELKNVVDVERMGGELNVHLKGDLPEIASFFKDLSMLDFPIVSMAESSNALEDKYLSLIKESR